MSNSTRIERIRTAGGGVVLAWVRPNGSLLYRLQCVDIERGALQQQVKSVAQRAALHPVVFFPIL